MNKLVLFKIFILMSLFGCLSNKEEGHHVDKVHEHETVESYYTCSMHPSVKEKEPGKCPICHMNLTKVEVEKNDDSVKKVETKHEHKTVESYYTCSMHPSIKEKEPGKCPICHMNLTKVEVDNEFSSSESNDSSSHQNASEVVAKVKLRKSQLKHFTAEVFPVTNMKMNKKIRLLGTVLQSEEKESSIPARVSGRVEKVFVKSTGSLIKVGDPVIQLYSPRLITAGEEYLIAKQSFLKSKTSEYEELLKQSEERLKLWGIRKFQYEKWFKLKKVPKKITIYSNTTGIVRKRNATVGKYFKEGQNFFELSDLADVWIEMDVYEQDSSLIKLGQVVKLEFSAIPGEHIDGEIDFINPVLDQKSRTLKVRATIKNTSGKLKPGMIANAVLNIEFDGEPLVVPRSAVIDTGKRKVVWIKDSEKQYKARTIITGNESEGYIEIKDGLADGDKVVIEGNFLLDAQAQLFGGYEDMKETP